MFLADVRRRAAGSPELVRGSTAVGLVSTKPRSGEGGFSLIELMLVVTVLGIVAAIAIPVSSSFIGQAKADSATAVALSAVERARDQAMAERRNFELEFVLPDRILVRRVEVPGPGKTLVAETQLENGQVFRLVPGVPDTDDAFGADSEVHFTGTAPVMFTSDGSLIDANGDVVNGSIFLAQRGQGDSIRAITILGVTGLVRTWKWSGTKWLE